MFGTSSSFHGLLIGGVTRSIGNELTPSAKYDFKFKDYAPWVFRELREDCFQLDPADYLLSLTAQYILSELGSPGKSGSFFYFSRDYRFIIKTIRHAEHKFLRSILKRYHAHVRENPHTLLSRFYGLHRVKLPHGRKIHFVIMNNLFPAHKDIHESYDLKGSTVGRIYPEERARENPRAVLKDVNWIDRGKELELGPEKRALLTEQLRRDAEFLKDLQVMDYSLLVGIHNMRRGNRDNVRRNTLRVFSPHEVHVPPQPYAQGNVHRRRAATATVEQPHVVRRAVHRNARTNLKRVGEGVLPEEETGWKGMSADRVRLFLFSLGVFFFTDGLCIAQDQSSTTGRICRPVHRVLARDHAWWRWWSAVQGRVKDHAYSRHFLSLFCCPSKPSESSHFISLFFVQTFLALA